MDFAKGVAILVAVAAIFYFLRWMMKPTPEVKKRAKEFGKMMEENRSKNYNPDYPSDEEQQPIFQQTRKEFWEGSVQHRPRTTPTKRPPPPPPPMRDGRGREVPLRSSSAMRDYQRQLEEGHDGFDTPAVPLGLTAAIVANHMAGDVGRYSHSHVSREPSGNSSSGDDYSPSDSGGGNSGGGNDD